MTLSLELQFGDEKAVIVFKGFTDNSFLSASDRIINDYFFAFGEVPTNSMENTIKVSDKILSLRQYYKNREPERFDVIVFNFPDDETELYVKRIIGLPGEKIEIKSGKVFIDDSETPLPDDFVFNLDSGNFGPYQTPGNSYFVMGDNRSYSFDSRYWQNSYVSREKILGKVYLVIHPDFAVVE
jgi:signal peptidase I